MPIDTPKSPAGQPSKSLSLVQMSALLAALRASDARIRWPVPGDGHRSEKARGGCDGSILVSTATANTTSKCPRGDTFPVCLGGMLREFPGWLSGVLGRTSARNQLRQNCNVTVSDRI